jgi:hypothetical protein
MPSLSGIGYRFWVRIQSKYARCEAAEWSVAWNTMLRAICASAAVHQSHDCWVVNTPGRYRSMPPDQLAA